jgi:desulfoferrodoxin-like iron-binding protein
MLQTPRSHYTFQLGIRGMIIAFLLGKPIESFFMHESVVTVLISMNALTFKTSLSTTNERFISMEQKQVNRREFFQTASIAGITVLTAGSIFKSTGAKTPPAVKKGIFICSVCGHIEFGSAPDACPVCHSAKDKFKRNDTIFTDTQVKFKDVDDKHTPVVRATGKSTLVTEKPSIEVAAKIGSVIHPMEESHHIRFIDSYIDDVYVSRLLLTLHNHPTVGNNIKTPGSRVRIVILCNLHGYWQSEAKVA